MQVNAPRRNLSHRWTRPGPSATVAAPAAAVVVVALAALTAVGGAHAQAPQSLPGITIVQPPPGMPSGQPATTIPNPMMQPSMLPQAAPPPQQQPEAAPKPRPKPRPKTAARPKAVATDVVDSPGRGGSGTRIALLVNGEPITAYEVEQRARLIAMSSDIQGRVQDTMKRLASSPSVNARFKQIVEETVQQHQRTKTREQIIALIQERQKAYAASLQQQAVASARASAMSQPQVRTKAREELIEEMIKLQDARRSGATPDEKMVQDLIKDIAKRNNKSDKELTQHFAAQGVDIATLKAKFRAQLAWTEAVRKQYSHLAVPNNRDIDLMLKTGDVGEDEVELGLRRILIPVPPKLDQKAMAQRLTSAQSLQAAFKDCRSTPGLAAKVPGAKYEDMGTRRASSFTGVSRTMLSNAQENTMIPPSMTGEGIELLAVCSRRVIKGVDVKRNEKANELRQERFELHARAHLRRLRNDAVIEQR
jgi:peptidyl-prolyl cis-trans isomerase SurA